MSFTQISYHVVFSTKERHRVLRAGRRKDLFNYLWGILKNKRCHLHQMNGVDDHIHMLIGLHPTVALADLVRDLKTSSCGWIKRENVFPGFTGWQSEYAAFTKSRSHREAVIDYIKNQEDHHKRESSLDELRRLLIEEGIEFDERYLK